MRWLALDPLQWRCGSLSLALASMLPAQQWVKAAGVAANAFEGVFDTRRGRFVSLASINGDVAEWSGFAWQSIAAGAPPFSAPVQRVGAAVTSDGIGRILMFGGQAVSTLGDFWAYDGLAWTQIPGSVTPARRLNAVMAYDSVRQRVVLYGGETGPSGTTLRDVWEHDGIQWNQVADGPAWTSGSRMVFDTARAQTVLLGSATSVYAGAGWQQLTADVTSATSRLSYDPLRQRVVLYRNDGAPQLREWNGAAWTTIALPTLPSLAAATLWFDPAVARLRIGSQTLGGSVLEWDGTALQRAAGDAVTPSGTWFFDSVRNRCVAFGGSLPLRELDETWSWDGRLWVAHAPATKPPARIRACAAFDSVRGVGLVYGGSSSSGLRNDLWSWDGSTWTPQGLGPVPVVFGMMVFDSARGRAVLFGGISPTGLNLDTWEWNGSSWSQVVTATRPSLGIGSMTFDPVRGRTVLLIGATTPPETWEYDGSQWVRVLTPQTPPAASLAGLTFDPARNRVVATAPLLGYGVREYDGATWTQRPGVADVPLAGQPLVAFDSLRQRLVAYDGYRVFELQNTAPEVASYGSNCGGAVLMTRTPPRLAEPRFGLDLAVEPGAVALFGLSASQAAVPLGQGCTLALGALFDSVVAVADARGLAGWSLPIPNAGALAGVAVFAQAGAIAAAGRLQLSQGLRLLIGE